MSESWYRNTFPSPEPKDFETWWRQFYGPESDTAPHFRELDEYWVRKGFARHGWNGLVSFIARLARNQEVSPTPTPSPTSLPLSDGSRFCSHVEDWEGTIHVCSLLKDHGFFGDPSYPKAIRPNSRQVGSHHMAPLPTQPPTLPCSYTEVWEGTLMQCYLGKDHSVLLPQSRPVPAFNSRAFPDNHFMTPSTSPPVPCPFTEQREMGTMCCSLLAGHQPPDPRFLPVYTLLSTDTLHAVARPETPHWGTKFQK